MKALPQLPNVSSDWKGSTRPERRLITRLLKHEGTGKAIVHFSKNCDRLSDYWYWFVLSSLWVSYSGWSDLNLWKKLLRGDRPNKHTSLMKPDEYAVFQRLPERIRVFRAHRVDETDWIAYTLDPQIAARFAVERGVDQVTEYIVHRDDVLALFLRRGEKEVIVLDKSKVQQLRVIDVVIEGGNP